MLRDHVRIPEATWLAAIAGILGLGLIAASFAVGAAEPPAKKMSTPTAPDARPLLPLGAGDVVNVQVYGRPELATTTYVAEDGSITVPLAGRVQVAGLSPTAAAQRVGAAYKGGQFLRNPQVTLLVSQARSQQVSVLGEVRTPGRYVVEGRTTVFDLLALAGGTNERGGNTVYLIRADGEGKLERTRIDLAGLNNSAQALPSMALRGGDSIYVPQADQYYIYGEVQQPNMYRLEPAMTVLQAISRSGGLTEYGNERRIEIKRRDANGVLKTMKASVQDPVLADDVIHVKETLF